MRKKQIKSSDLTTARSVLAALGIKQLGVGSYIQVEQDLTVNKCSHGGIGFVEATVGDGAQRTFTVKYSGETRTESEITYCRATEKMPYGVARPVRDRQCPRNPRIGSHQWSRRQLESERVCRRRKGWREKKVVFQIREFALPGREGIERILERETEGESPHSTAHKKRKNKLFNPITLAYLAKAWKVGPKYTNRVLKRQAESTVLESDRVPNPTLLSVIESLAAAKINSTAKNLFMEYRAPCLRVVSSIPVPVSRGKQSLVDHG
jgi:hypothetical protein